MAKYVKENNSNNFKRYNVDLMYVELGEQNGSMKSFDCYAPNPQNAMAQAIEMHGANDRNMPLQHIDVYRVKLCNLNDR